MSCMRVVLIVASLATALLSACGGSQKTDEKFLIEAFKIKNPGINVRKYTTKSFTSGTVPARSVGFAENSRLKATLGCFDWVYSMPGDSSETESSMCIYYVYGPDGGGGRIWWRGDVAWLKSVMDEQGFQS